MSGGNTIKYDKGFEKEPKTLAWELYETGRAYNNSLSPNQYSLVDTNIEFYVGNQWKNLPQTAATSSLPKPVFNVIKRVGSLFVAALTSSATSVNYEPLQNRADGEEAEEGIKAARMATAEVMNLFDKLKMDFRLREALFDGFQTGDYCFHFYWDPNKMPYGGAYGIYRGEVCMDVVDGINVMFGNPNNHVVDDQPYILILGRDTVESLREEYRRHHKKSNVSEGGSIQSDSEWMDQAASGGKTELINGDEYGKALYVYMYRKVTREVTMRNPDGSNVMEVVTDKAGNPVIDEVDGFPMMDAAGAPIYKMRPVKEFKTTIHVSKHTRNVTIFDEVDTELSYYPIAWGNWERQKNQYHGRAQVTGIIPNQIYINSMFALVMRHQQMLGFPKILYNGNYIQRWDNTVGQALAINNLPDGVSMNAAYAVIQPADMSSQIMATIKLAIDLTKESLGATDAQLGNVKPDNTSALIAVQSQSEVPLDNPMTCKYEFVEDVGRILLDMMGTYYGERPVVETQTVQISTKKATINPNNGQPVSDPNTGEPLMEDTIQTQTYKAVVMYDFSKLKNVWLNVRADVGASTYWSKIAMVQTLDNLLGNGLIDLIEYFERMPDEYIPMKEELITARKNLQAQQAGLPSGQADPAPASSGGGIAGGGESNDSLLSTMSPSTQAKFETMPAQTKNALLQQAELRAVGRTV